MRVLITGHRGFIGQHLEHELLCRGWDVRGADLVEGADLCREGVIERLLDQLAPERVVHLAAQVGRIFGERSLCHTIERNATMTTLLAHACGRREIPVMYASSSEVYGDHGDMQVTERTRCLLPHNLYGLSKRWGEEALQLYAPDGLQVVRLSMPYGPGAPPGEGRRAMDNIIWQAQHRKTIPIHRGAERSWCYIEDTVRGMRLVLEKGESGHIGVRGHGVYNIGRDDHPLAMASLAGAVCELVGAPQELIEIVDPPQQQTLVKRLSTDKLRGLGWWPRVELAPEGLQVMVKWISRFDEDGKPRVFKPAG